MSLIWAYSYATVGFATADGDLAEGQYAVSLDGRRIYYRPTGRDKSETQFLSGPAQSTAGRERVDTTGLTRVNRSGVACYHVFRDTDTGRDIRLRCTGQEYAALGLKGARAPTPPSR